MKKKKDLSDILKKSRQSILRSSIIGLLSLLLFILFIVNDNSIEFFFLDMKFYINTYIINNSADTSEYISVILQDTYAENKLNIENILDWRKHNPSLIKVLTESQAALIVFDVEFRDQGITGDKELADAFKRAGNVITGEITQNATLPLFKEHISLIGDLNLKEFNDRPRKVTLMEHDESRQALSLVTAEQYLNIIPENKKEKVISANQLQQLKNRGYFWINYSKPIRYFNPVSYSDVIESTKVPFFKDKIIIIGHYSDVNYYPHTFYKTYAGVFAQAYGIENIILNNYIRKVPVPGEFFFFIICFIIIQGLYELSRGKIKPVLLFLFSLLFLILLFSLECIIQYSSNLWLNFSTPLVTLCITGLVHIIYSKIAIRKQLKEIDLYRQQISQFEYQHNVVTGTILDDILHKVTKLRSCIRAIKRESTHNSRLTKYFDLTAQSCDDVQFLSSLLKGDKVLSLSRVNIARISDIIKELCELPEMSTKGIHIEVSPRPGDFILHTDFHVLQNLVKDIFKNIVDMAQKQSTIRITITSIGEECRISFQYTGSTYPKNNLLFKKELIKRVNGNLQCSRSKDTMHLILSFSTSPYN